MFTSDKLLIVDPVNLKGLVFTVPFTDTLLLSASLKWKLPTKSI